MSAGPAARPIEPTLIPIDVVNGHVLVRVWINRRAATLVLDTGSSTTTLDVAWAEWAGLRPLGEPVRAIGADQLAVRLAPIETLELGNIRLTSLTAALLPLEPVVRAAGCPIHGTLGYELFQRYVVEIDYAGRVLRLWDAAGFGWPGPGVLLPIELVHWVPVIPARLCPTEGAGIDARLVLDLGSSLLAIRLSAAFVQAHPTVFDDLAGYVAPIGTGVGGTLLGRVARLFEVRLGPLALGGVPVGVGRDAKGALALPVFDGTIGAPLLERLRPIVDYRRSRVILQPGEELGTPFATDASGLVLDAPAPDFASARVRFVVEASPAAEAGLAERDEIVRVDGKPVGELGLDQVRRLLRESEEERRLLVRRAGGDREVTLRLRALV